MPEIQQDDLEQVVRDSKFDALAPEDQEAARKEESVVKKIWDEYTQARDFDNYARAQYAIDRRYAAGTADKRWAVSTNLIGTFIDILTSFLYSRDPAVRVRKAKQVDNNGTKDMDTFAKTMELVITRLWKKGRLKTAIRKQVRSSLSVGTGYLKVLMIGEDSERTPQFRNEMNDLRDNLVRLEAVEKALEAAEADTDKVEEELQAQKELIASLEVKIEATIRKYLAIDFVPAQNFQCSLDVENTEDHLIANWNADATYVLKTEARAMFPRLTETEINAATFYYQRRMRNQTPLTDQPNMPAELGGSGTAADEAEQFTKGDATTSALNGGSGANPPNNGPAFIRVIELWDKRTNHIKTMVEGVKRWAKEPYQPAYASSRIYPYFRLAFYEVDGERHPQSLSGRNAKLQDEYSASRSSWRMMRERAIPATLFDATNIEKNDVKKIETSVHQEYIGITPVDPTKPIKDSFFSKAYEHVDPRMFENGPIKEDMEKVTGVQEALQSSVTAPKTATESKIQQSGFASRVTSDRDSLEDMLTDLAGYTAETALQCLQTKDVQRIAGAGAFWPEKMDIEDLVTMVEIDIEAGSTGKPKEDEDKQAWGVVLPVIKEAILEINSAIQGGQLQLAKCLRELVVKTMEIMGDDTDPDQYLPVVPDDPSAGLAPVGAPPVSGQDPSLPPSAGQGAAGGAPSNDVQAPTVEAPNVQAPAI